MFLEAASEYTGLPVRTLRYFRQYGGGPKSFKLGGRVAYLASDLDAWVAEQRAATVTR